MSCFRFRDGLIAHYGEAFDRGVALVQLDFSAERIKHILARAATAQTATRKANVTFIAFPLGERQRVLEWVRCPDREHSNQCQKAKSRKGCSCST